MCVNSGYKCLCAKVLIEFLRGSDSVVRGLENMRFGFGFKRVPKSLIKKIVNVDIRRYYRSIIVPCLKYSLREK